MGRVAGMSQLSEQRTAQGKDPHLWALDLDPRYWLPWRYKLPCAAHLIVEVVNDPDDGHEIRIAACGARFTAANHPEGWWSTLEGELPLAAHAIHCGADVIRTRRDLD
jgi:hypothetical protein